MNEKLSFLKEKFNLIQEKKIYAKRGKLLGMEDWGVKTDAGQD